MNPQAQSSVPQGTPGQNMPSEGEGEPKIDGFGGPNIVYENYSNEVIQENQQAQQEAGSSIPINVINAVNANGIVSGRKVVDYTWQRGAICLAVLALGLLIGLIVVIVMMMGKTTEIVSLKKDRDSANNNLQGILTVLNVGSKEEAMAQITDPEILDGGDLEEVAKLLTDKYGVEFALDLADHNINFVRRNGFYRIVSLGVQQESGTRRVLLYEKVADGKWVLSGFDSTKDAPCEDATEEDKEALKNIVVCEVKEETE